MRLHRLDYVGHCEKAHHTNGEGIFYCRDLPLGGALSVVPGGRT